MLHCVESKDSYKLLINNNNFKSHLTKFVYFFETPGMSEKMAYAPSPPLAGCV